MLSRRVAHDAVFDAALIVMLQPIPEQPAAAEEYLVRVALEVSDEDDEDDEDDQDDQDDVAEPASQSDESED